MIEITGVRKRFGSFDALDGVDLKVEPGELLALLGPSGSGKTTLLRIIAGLEQPDSGIVRFAGEDATHRHVRDRSVGFVFQHYALFRHMTVFDNVAFGLNVKPRAERPSRTEIRDRAMELLRLVQIDWLADRYPNQLSGGQRQRVALARALAIQPKVLLLDEPFGALDAKVRRELRRWLRRLHDGIEMTTVFVTHDQEEALEVADRLVVMGRGRIEQIGTAEEIYDQPANAFVYQFLGDVNRFRLEREGDRLAVPGLRVANQPMAAAAAASAGFVRPPHHDQVRDPPRPGVIRFVALAGPTVRIEVAVDGHDQGVDVELPRDRYRQLGLGVGDRVAVSTASLRVFPADELTAKAE
jgi:sulfate transport system ATP-binding protein